MTLELDVCGCTRPIAYAADPVDPIRLPRDQSHLTNSPHYSKLIINLINKAYT
jgi:hypothetical protein